jgi:outer membrane murein-binding lipoprotein Lpp
MRIWIIIGLLALTGCDMPLGQSEVEDVVQDVTEQKFTELSARIGELEAKNTDLETRLKAAEAVVEGSRWSAE